MLVVGTKCSELELVKLRKALKDRNQAIGMFRERLTELNTVMDQDWSQIRIALMSRFDQFMEAIESPQIRQRCQETLKELLDASIVPEQAKNVRLRRALSEAVAIGGFTAETVSFSKAPTLAAMLQKEVEGNLCSSVSKADVK